MAARWAQPRELARGQQKALALAHEKELEWWAAQSMGRATALVRAQVSARAWVQGLAARMRGKARVRLRVQTMAKQRALTWARARARGSVRGLGLPRARAQALLWARLSVHARVSAKVNEMEKRLGERTA